MTVPIIIIGVILVIGIIFLTGQSSTNKLTREGFLQELVKYMDGKLEPMQDMENSFRVTFAYRGQTFFFDDIKEVGFRDNVFKSILKVETNINFNLNFTERQMGKALDGKIQMASDITEDAFSQKKVIKLPADLQKFEAHTNNIDHANILLADQQVAAIFTEFKNISTKGYSFVALRILHGVVMLEFQTASGMKPPLSALYQDVPSIEIHCNKLASLAQKITSLL